MGVSRLLVYTHLCMYIYSLYSGLDKLLASERFSLTRSSVPRHVLLATCRSHLGLLLDGVRVPSSSTSTTNVVLYYEYYKYYYF
jgi:hypothetical protein